MFFRGLCFALLSAQAIHAGPVIAAYYSPWSQWSYKEIPYHKLTHLYLSFFMPDGNGNMPVDGGIPNIDSLVSRAHAAGVKVLPALGGGGTAPTFAAIAGSAAKRATLAHTTRKFLEKNGFDGLDIDWEFPTLADTAALRLMVSVLRDTLDAMDNGKRGKLITLAVNCGTYYGQFYRLERFIDKYDLICSMTYDMAGPWSGSTWYNSPLYGDDKPDNYSVQAGMDYWAGRGVPKSKLLTGTAFYGHTFKNATGINQPNKGVGSGDGDLKYQDIVPMINSGFYKYRWDDVSKVPWGLSSTNEFVTFDDPRSVAIKGRWLLDQGYAGTAIWEISGDIHSGSEYKLLDSLYASLHPPVATEIKPVVKNGKAATGGKAGLGERRDYLADGRRAPIAWLRRSQRADAIPRF